MPESTEVTDEVLETRHRKCLAGSAGLESVKVVLGRPQATRCVGSGASLGISVASGSSLLSLCLTRNDTRSLDTRKPSSVKSDSADMMILRPRALRDKIGLRPAKCVFSP